MEHAKRISVLLGRPLGAIGAAVLAAVLVCALSAQAAPATRIDILYLGADDCFYCQHWEAARKPELLDAIRGRNARLFEIRAKTLREPITAQHYPGEFRWLHREVGDLRGVPRFLLLLDGRVELHVIGTNAYTAVLFPRLQKALTEDR